VISRLSQSAATSRLSNIAACVAHKLAQPSASWRALEAALSLRACRRLPQARPHLGQLSRLGRAGRPAGHAGAGFDVDGRPAREHSKGAKEREERRGGILRLGLVQQRRRLAPLLLQLRREHEGIEAPRELLLKLADRALPVARREPPDAAAADVDVDAATQTGEVSGVAGPAPNPGTGFDSASAHHGKSVATCSEASRSALRVATTRKNSACP